MGPTAVFLDAKLHEAGTLLSSASSGLSPAQVSVPRRQACPRWVCVYQGLPSSLPSPLPSPSPSQIPPAGEQHLSACPPVRLSTCPYSRGALGKEARQGRSTRSPPTCLPPGAASREQHTVPGPPTGTPRSALWGPVSWEDPAQPRPPQSGSPWVLQGGGRRPGALPGVSQLQSTGGGSADPQLLGRESGGSGREPTAPRPPAPTRTSLGFAVRPWRPDRGLGEPRAPV